MPNLSTADAIRVGPLAVSAVYKGTSQVWTPPSIDPATLGTLVQWLKADAITGVSDGSAVGTWAAAAGANAVQATGTKQPLLRASGIGGKPALEFDGTDDVMTIATTPPTTDMCVFAVAEVDSTAAGNRTVYGGNVTTTMEVRGSGAAWQVLRNVASTTVIAGSAVASENAIVCGRRDGAVISAYKNSKTANASSSPTGNYVGASMVVGGLSASSFFDGKIAELLVYSGTLTSGNFGKVWDYLSTKYGIAVSP